MFLNSIERIIFELNESNVQASVDSTMNFFDKSSPYSFNMIVITLVIAAFESSMKEVNLYIDYLKTIQTKEELIGKNNPNIIDILHNCLLHIRQPNYFLGKLLEQNLMEVNCDNNDQSSYFIHYQTKEEIRPTYNFNKRSYDDFIIDNYDELSKNDWELHKQLIKEGINPNEISKIIRNDEIEKLQEIASQTEFDFNQKIKPSLYERCSFINEEYVTLIDYAAFFGSVKCFKYLLINGANMINTGKYAVAGANTEIIHLCEQNHSSLKYIYETAIRLHRNYIFHYFYDNKIIEINDLGELINKCIQYSNYEILSFLEESLEDEDIEITNSRINTCIIHGNLYLLQKYYKNNYNFDKIFSYIKFENPEIIEFLFQQKCIKSSTTTKELFFDAVGNNRSEIVDILLNRKMIDVNSFDKYKQTPLIIASICGGLETIKVLLKQKDIDVNAKNKFGMTALMYACIYNNFSIVKLLLQHKEINVNAKHSYKYSDSDYKHDFDHTLICEKIHTQNDGKFFYKDEFGATALMLSCIYDSIKSIKLLLEHKKIDVNIQDGDGYTALICACKNFNIDAVKLLVNHKGIELNIQNNVYYYILLLKIFNWCLLEKFKTALMYSAGIFVNTEIVKILVEQKGIDLNIKDIHTL